MAISATGVTAPSHSSWQYGMAVRSGRMAVRYGSTKRVQARLVKTVKVRGSLAKGCSDQTVGVAMARAVVRSLSTGSPAGRLFELAQCTVRPQ